MRSKVIELFKWTLHYNCNIYNLLTDNNIFTLLLIIIFIKGFWGFGEIGRAHV